MTTIVPTISTLAEGSVTNLEISYGKSVDNVLLTLIVDALHIEMLEVCLLQCTNHFKQMPLTIYQLKTVIVKKNLVKRNV